MTFEEKRKLSINLESLPGDKLERIVQIIKKRNPEVGQNEDEIEVDIDSFDNDTLWELDRFITNCMKSRGKKAKKANQKAQHGFSEAPQVDFVTLPPPFLSCQFPLKLLILLHCHFSLYLGSPSHTGIQVSVSHWLKEGFEHYCVCTIVVVVCFRVGVTNTPGN